MRKWILLLLCAAVCLTGCARETAGETTAAAVALCAAEETALPETTAAWTEAAAEETEPVTEAAEAYAVQLSEEDQIMLMKMVMGEKEGAWCTECCALMMCTVLNRVNSDRYPDTVSGVLSVPNQFPPMEDGRYEAAEPNGVCREAMDMVLRGWDESQGALFYEFYDGETWHSRTLKKVTEHCDVRFYVEK